MADEYCTIAHEATAEFTERRSRFLGSVRPVSTEEDALAYINEKKKEYWDATHNVYAYRLRDSGIERFTDAGEPQGTAGVPMLTTLQKRGVTDCVVVLTRYFGGILLGAGGLVRAYSHGATVALDAGGLLRMKRCRFFRLSCDYGWYGKILPTILSSGGVLDDTAFGEDVVLRYHIPCDKADGLQKELVDVSAGRLCGEEERDDWCPFSDKIPE